MAPLSEMVDVKWSEYVATWQLLPTAACMAECTWGPSAQPWSDHV